MLYCWTAFQFFQKRTALKFGKKAVKFQNSLPLLEKI